LVEFLLVLAIANKILEARSSRGESSAFYRACDVI
jgi:hypothetical protein